MLPYMEVFGIRRILYFLIRLIFRGFEKRVLEILQNMPYITEESRVIVEASNQTMFDDVSGLGFDVEKEKIYKTNKHVFFGRKEHVCRQYKCVVHIYKIGGLL